MPFPYVITDDARRSLRDVRFSVLWLDSPQRPGPRPLLTGATSADLVVIGGGFSGLWTALLARERFPHWDVVLLEGDRIAGGASGRNGGFVSATLTHGLANGLARWPNEVRDLVRLGNENLDAIQSCVESEGIDCDFLRSGDLCVATEPYQVDALGAFVNEAASAGVDLRFLEAAEVRSRINSPTYLGATFDRRGVAMTDPARLGWGLAAAAERRGVRIHEDTPVVSIDADGAGLRVSAAFGEVRAHRVALATSAYPPLLRRLSAYVVPVYDSVLATEPLTASQRSEIGWSDRVGVSDSGNQFHYYRMTDDGRIVWGGYDASYYGAFNPRHERHPEPYLRLAEHFRYTFPQLDGVKFANAWTGAIDTCTRFSAFWGTAYRGRLAYSLGFTGLGVGASRFGAQVMLDLLSGEQTERTALKMVRTKPIPFPPEPLRGVGIKVTRRALDSADRREGRRNLWLRALDRIGMGYDS